MNRSRDRRTPYGRKGKLIEGQIPDVLLGFYQLALSIRNGGRRKNAQARAEGGGATCQK
jgi:hypothetical protein